MQTIEDKYFQSFANSEYYNEMLKVMNRSDVDEIDSSQMNDEKGVLDCAGISMDASLNVGDHSNYAKRKLDQLQEKLNNKNQVLIAVMSISFYLNILILGRLYKL